MEIDILPDSDCMYVENGEAWFVSRLYNILFRMNLASGNYEYIGVLPERGEDKWRFHSVCVKNREKIYCLPDRGACIWVYDLENSSSAQIKLAYPDNLRITMKYLGQHCEKLYTVSIGLKEIFAIDLEKQEILYSYALSDDIKEVLSGNNIMVGNKVYGVLNSSKTIIYEFDVDTKENIRTVIDERKAFYNTIAFDGGRFWLSGAQKEIMIWSKSGGNVEYIDAFTKNLHILNFVDGCVESVGDIDDIWEPLFCKSIVLNGKIWFIPFRTDRIINIDINTYKVHELLLPYEEEDRLTLKRREKNLRKYKFFFEYILEEKYMVVYSLKRSCHYSIDTLTGEIEERPYAFTIDSDINFSEKFANTLINKIFFDFNEKDIFQYKWLLARGKQKQNAQTHAIGKNIYQELVETN